MKPFQSVADWGSWQLHIRARRQTHKPYKGKAKYQSLLHKRLLEGNFSLFSNVLFIAILLSFNSFQCQGFPYFIQKFWVWILFRLKLTVFRAIWSMKTRFLAASDLIEVIVSTVVIPKETRAGVASTAIQNDTQLKFSINSRPFKDSDLT